MRESSAAVADKATLYRKRHSAGLQLLREMDVIVSRWPAGPCIDTATRPSNEVLRIIPLDRARQARLEHRAGARRDHQRRPDHRGQQPADYRPQQSKR